MTDYRAIAATSPADDENEEHVADPSDLKAFPALADWLTRYRYDGKSIKTATLSIWADDGRWKARVSDREENRTLWLTLEDPNNLFSEVEEALNSGNPGFRTDKQRRV